MLDFLQPIRILAPGHAMQTLTAEIVALGPLTPAEGDVLKLVCEGNLRWEIAKRRCRSEKTVSAQLDSISGKLDAHGSTEIVCKAVAKGLVRISMRGVLIFWLSFGVTVNDHLDKRRPNCRYRCAERSIRVRDI
jgi:DNA-binding CsgD family transcriptional regulator